MEKLKSLWKKVSEFFFGKEEPETKQNNLFMDAKNKFEAPTVTFTPGPSTIVLPSTGYTSTLTSVAAPNMNFTPPEPVKTIVVTNPIATIKFTEVDHTGTPAKKTPTKKAPTKKAVVVKKSPAKKAIVKKAVIKKAPVKKAPVKKAPAKKIINKKKK